MHSKKIQMKLSFDNSEIAFKYKTDKDLRNAKWLFSSMKIPYLSALGTAFTPWIIKSGLPIKGLIRNTIFKQFVGGESLQDTKSVTDTLAKFNVQSILDFGVEGKETDEVFEHTTKEYIRLIQYAASNKSIPYLAVKITGIASFELLEKLHGAPRLRSGIHDNEEQVAAWERVTERLQRICRVAKELGVGVMIDAEESWIQDPIDRIAMDMMQQFNQEKVIVMNTIQLYRHDRLAFLKLSHEIAKKGGFFLGVKLVRGAYMEKERARAQEKGYASPIQENKEATDRDYNLAVEYCLQNMEDITFFVASHNEHSNLLAANYLVNNRLPLNHPHVHFSQLYGMSDDITFNLADAGFSVCKYVPYGPLEEVIPYLMRRASENTSVQGQTSRELVLINKELQRRKMKKQRRDRN